MSAVRVCAFVVCTLAWAPTCLARLSRGEAPKVVEVKAHGNRYLDQSLGKDLAHLASVLGSSGKKPEPQAMSVDHADFTCKKLFAYKETRDACFRLQPVLCGKDCKALLPDESNITKCENVQKTICAVEDHKQAPKPVTLPGHNGINATTTFCHAYPTEAEIHIQHDKYYALQDPEPFIKDMKYFDCKQARLPAGEAVNIFLGNYPAATHVAGGENAIIMIGQYKLGEYQMGITAYAFKDEGYKRPVVCNAYPEPEVGTAVAGREWHPYVHAQHPRHLKYMECEKLNLDHVDSQKDPESLEFSVDGKVKGHALVSPVHSLYVVGSKQDADKSLVFKEYNYDHGTLRESL